VHALTHNEVFGFESSAALIALLLVPFALRDLLAPRVRSWRLARRSNGVPVAASPGSSRMASSGATIIRLADRKRPRVV
jgi:hypothetical protein